MDSATDPGRAAGGRDGHEVTAARATAPAEPQRELGGYRLLRRIGSGGMGEVHEAVDGDGHRVALKLLHPHVAREAASRARLAREVQLLHRVRAPGVARVIDAEVEDSEAFVVTELVDGPTLEADVAEHGAFSAEEIVMLAHGLADALRAIHAADIVHRDLKPGNVMLSPDGPVLIDFGIAQVVDDERLTQTGLVTGTPGYLDPEVLAGAEPSPACDWWAWAAVLVHASTARPPFGRGPTAAVLGRVATGRVDLEGVEPLLARALAAALSPDPAHRLDPSAVLDVIDGEIGRDGLEERIAERQAREPSSAVHGVLPADHAATGVLPGGAPGAPHAPHDSRGAHGGAGHGAEVQGPAGYRAAGHVASGHGPSDHRSSDHGAPTYPPGGGADGRTRVADPAWAEVAGHGAAGGYDAHGYDSHGGAPAGAPPGGQAPRSYPPGSAERQDAEPWADGGGQRGAQRYGSGPSGGQGRPIGPLGLDRPDPETGPYGRNPGGLAAYGNAGTEPPDGAGARSFLGEDGRPPAWARPPARRTGVAAAAGLAMATIAPHAPGWFLVLLVISTVLLAAWGQADRARRNARLRRGVRAGDTGRMLAAMPWYLVVGALTSAVGMIIGLVLAASVVLGAELLSGEPASPPVLLLAGILAVCGVWLAPTGSNAREGFRSVVGALAPGRLGRIVLLAAFLALAAVAGGTVALGAAPEPTWWPLPDLGSLTAG
ncbi:protein kinase domain-containing protein [Georgenia sp. Z1491]|uniref:protein kinase domain-containing protein n=1 Tax=Georgenia sp. Z1491 TaxID=3416707 RepID=UPI003CF3DA00